jgi:hypothetical protein
VVPGADAARRAVADGLSLPQRLTPVYLHQQPGSAFDAALRDIAHPGRRHCPLGGQDPAIPTTNPQLSGTAWPWTLTLRPILLAGLAALAAAVGIRLLRRRRRGRSAETTGQPHRPNQRDTSSNVEPSFHLTRRRS